MTLAISEIINKYNQIIVFIRGLMVNVINLCWVSRIIILGFVKIGEFNILAIDGSIIQIRCIMYEE